MKCPECQDCGWVCEVHPEKPWDGPQACDCGAAGAPCPRCNVPEPGATPRPPSDFRIQFDKDGWRH